MGNRNSSPEVGIQEFLSGAGIPFQQQSPWKREKQGMQLEIPIKKSKKRQNSQAGAVVDPEGLELQEKTGRGFLG